ncbi:MAG: xanthine dehydrogenase [Clostridiales bacterium]|nr:xanthine dehydrogenase [Clostridiales bacterium]
MFNNLYGELLVKVNGGEKCIMVTHLKLHNDRNGSIEGKVLLSEEDVKNKSYSLEDSIYERMHFSLDTGKPEIIETGEDKAILIEAFIPKPRLFIFGGGHVAKPVSEFASRVGFSVVIIDDRPTFANTSRFPEAEQVICEDFDKSFDLIDFRETDFVVIVTRGHRYDGIVLREALKHKLNYIGMMGSKRRVKAMMQELAKEGFDKEILESVKSPIGLDIGGVTPDEIAISIVGQLISYKNKGLISKLGKEHVFPEFDLDVFKSICEESSIPRALITILSSKGSTPRKAGTKMIAYLDGRTVGSIGGGCSEAAIVSKARTVMDEKGFSIEHVDMTGEIAESEGMVCGGIMEVLIESF